MWFNVCNREFGDSFLHPVQRYTFSGVLLNKEINHQITELMAAELFRLPRLSEVLL